MKLYEKQKERKKNHKTFNNYKIFLTDRQNIYRINAHLLDEFL